MTTTSSRRVLAVPIMGDRGGGVGQVSQLLWDSMKDTWPGRVDLVTLLRNGHIVPTPVDKLRFGLDLASRQAISRPRCVVFSHLGLAQMEDYVPEAFQVPYAIFLHGIEVWRPLEPRELDVLRGASLRIANSAFTAQAAKAANPGIGDIEVCPLSLPKRARHAAAGDASRYFSRSVLVVGRLASSERYKGHEQLLRCWPAVTARVPDAELVIAGDGDDLPRLKSIAADAGVSASVRFTGFLTREDLDAEYGNAALFAMPSRGEGFGIVYLEAMAHGLACIGSIHDAASEVIVDGETGVLVDPDNTLSLSQSIATLLTAPDLRMAMGAQGRTRVDRHFRYEHFRDRVTSLLRQAFPLAVTV